MLVVKSNGSCAYNLDRLDSIVVDVAGQGSYRILAYIDWSKSVVDYLGTYETRERAKSVFEDILHAYDCGKRVYYLPKE